MHLPSRLIITSKSLLSVSLLLTALCRAADVDGTSTFAPRKDGFTWFNPTPAALMRELSTDRPDKTECPFTVDAGHVQVELDWGVYSRDHDTAQGADFVETAWTVAPVNFKVGLNNWSDLQFVIEPLVITETEDRTAQPRQHEKTTVFGDITVRYKANFWGNDGGGTALAVMPFVKLPIHNHGIGSDAVEGGVIVPYSHDLPSGWGLGMQTEVDVTRNLSGHGYHAEFVNSITAGHALGGKLDGYVELFSQHSAERGARWVGTFDVGVTCGLTSNLQLDAGVNIGISNAAPDLEIFTGISRRF